MSKKFNLIEYLTAKLVAMGAKPGTMRELAIDTKAGVLEISIYDGEHPWIACIFDDVAKARDVVKSGCLNKHSGKWNWHGQEGEDRKELADFFIQKLEAIV